MKDGIVEDDPLCSRRCSDRRIGLCIRRYDQGRGLAPVICDELMAAFTRLAEGGEMTILLVEQRLESALDYADSVMILDRRRMVRKGAGETLRSDHELVERSIGVGSLH